MRSLLGLALGLATLLLPQTRLYAQAPTSTTDAHMSILVHITHGPENPTRAALGFAVAAAAAEQGHEVTVFLAGDAVQLARGGGRSTRWSRNRQTERITQPSAQRRSAVLSLRGVERCSRAGERAGDTAAFRDGEAIASR